MAMVSWSMAQQVREVTNQGLNFVPDDIRILLGDTLRFSIASSHNVEEVDQDTWENNQNNPNGGFSAPFGGGDVIISEAGTYYYICQPHVGASMKGIVRVNSGIRITGVDPVNDQITISNFGSETIDISAYRLCSEFNYTPDLSSLTTVDGDLALESASAVTMTGFALTDEAADIGLYLPEGGFGSADAMVDFFQWGSDGNGRESVAVEKGIWTAGEFAEGSGPFAYTGDGLENGLSVWEVEETRIALDEDFIAILTGTQEVTPVMTTAGGRVTADLNGDTLIVSGSFSGLTAPVALNVGGGAHIHLGLAGQNGGIEFPLNFTLSADSLAGTFEADSNTFVLDADQLAALNERRLYVNIHSQFVTSGEIRGQLLPAADAYYMANLYGSNEVPSLISGGGGNVLMELRGDSLTVTGAFSTLDGAYNEDIGSHIHAAKFGSNGGVIFPLSPVLNEDLRGGVYEAADNQFILSQGQIDTLMDRGYYVNIHTTASAPGEIRGQVGAISNVRFRSFLAGSHEVPLVVSGASGGALVELFDSTLIISGSFAGLESDFNTDIAGGAHIHRGFAGQNGGIEFLLNTDTSDDSRNGQFSVADNTFELTSGQIDTLMARQYYINIHSTDIPSGEIRGQIVPEKQYFFQAYLSGTQEVTPVLSTGIGAVIGEVQYGTLTLSGSFANLGSPVATNIGGGAHIHEALAGTNGPVIFPIAFELDEDQQGGIIEAESNNFELNDTTESTLIERAYYVNIHSENNNPGEVRGQLLHEAKAYFAAPLSGTSEPVAVNSGGTGAMMVEWKGNQALVSGSFNNLSSALNTDIAGGAHIHVGYAGQNGGIVFPLASTLSADSLSGEFLLADNRFELREGLVDTLRRRQLYVNIHSLNNPPGEIRGNILPPAMAYLTATFSGVNEVQPVSSTGFGALKAEVTGNTLVLTGAFQDLVGDFNFDIAGGSHLHIGGPGENGPIRIGLNASVDSSLKSGIYMPDSNSYELEEGWRDEILGGNWYFNLHTTEVPSGELRGQVLSESNFFPSDEATITAPEDGAVVVVDGDSATAFAATWDAATDVDDNTLVYIWQLSASEDFTQLLVQANVGAETSFTTNFGVVDSILSGAGLNPGDSITVFHRAIASDGSVATPGGSASVTLVKGVVTDLDDEIVKAFDWKIYPSPVHGDLTISINSPVAGKGSVSLMDISGRTLIQKSVQVNSGIQAIPMSLDAVSAGMYILQVAVDDTAIITEKIVKK